MIIGKLRHGSDLLRELNKLAASEGISAGFIQLMGSIARARLSFYDQKIHAYRELDFDSPHEIVSAGGNISLRDDKPYVHLHLAVADATGKVVGGHCLQGCKVFAVEFAIWPFKGEAPRRALDHTTGLLLWTESTYREK